MKNTNPSVPRINRTSTSKQLLGAALVASLLTSTAFAAAPVNDNLGQAIPIASSLPVTVTGSNIDATAQPGEPNHSDSEAAGEKSVWWSWTSPITGTITLSTFGSGIEDSTAENGYRDTVDTQVGVYTGTGIANLVLVARKEDSDGQFAKGWTLMTFEAVAGTNYKIAVDGWDGQTGPVIKLTLTSGGVTPPPPPTGFGLTINITPATAGEVTVSPEPGSGGYANGTVVTLTATPTASNEFSAWGGAANGSSNEVTVTMNGNKTVNAIFNANNEILVQSVDKRIGAWLFDGASFLGGSMLRNGIPLNGWRVVGTADYNADDKRDVLLQHPDGRLTVWFMNGTSFVSHTPIGAPPANLQARAVADFDGNGSPDVAFQNTDNNSIVIWLYTGTTFDSAVAVRDGKPAVGRRLIGAADVDAAGGVDLVFAVSNGRIAAWTLTGTTFNSAIPLASSRAANPAVWTAVGVFDMDNNGSQDILFQNADGRSAVWFQNGTAFVNAIVLRNGFAVAPGAKLVTAN